VWQYPAKQVDARESALIDRTELASSLNVKRPGNAVMLFT